MLWSSCLSISLGGWLLFLYMLLYYLCNPYRREPAKHPHEGVTPPSQEKPYKRLLFAVSKTPGLRFAVSKTKGLRFASKPHRATPNFVYHPIFLQRSARCIVISHLFLFSAVVSSYYLCFAQKCVSPSPISHGGEQSSR